MFNMGPTLYAVFIYLFISLTLSTRPCTRLMILVICLGLEPFQAHFQGNLQVTVAAAV